MGTLEQDAHRTPEDKVFKRGAPVTYRYGAVKVHATVSTMSKTGKRVRISYRRQDNRWDEIVYVKPDNLEHGHV
jgi:hypothetical protein